MNSEAERLLLELGLEAGLLSGLRAGPQGEAVRHVGLACSGGLDSSVLLDLLPYWRRHFPCAQFYYLHFSHGWEPERTAQEVEFCRRQARSYGLTPILGSWEELDPGLRPADSLGETRARESRRLFFAQWLAGLEAPDQGLILLAQHADDQAETLLQRLFRGTGPRGAGCMRSWSPPFLRPFLDLERADLEAYARRRELKLWLDPSNGRADNPRNFLRLEVLPQLEARFGSGLSRRLAQFAQFCQEQEDFCQDQLELWREAWNEGCGRGPGPRLIPRALYLSCPVYVRRRLLMETLDGLLGGEGELTATHVSQLCQALDRGTKSDFLTVGGLRACVSQGSLRLWPAGPLPTGDLELAEGRRYCLGCPSGPFVIPPHLGYNFMQWKTLYKGEIRSGGLRLRQTGDYLYWRGRRRSLKQFLQEQGVPFELRSRLLLYAEGQRVLYIPHLFADVGN